MSPVGYKPKDYRPAQPRRRSSRLLNFITCVGILSLSLIAIGGLYQLLPPPSQFADARQPQFEPTPTSYANSTPSPSPLPSDPQIPSPTTVLLSSPIPSRPAPTAPTPTPPSCSTKSDIRPQTSDGIIASFQSNWQIILRDGNQSWSDPTFHPLLVIWQQTVRQLACTPFLTSALGGHTLIITANDLGTWWGQYDGQYQQQINLQAQNASLDAYPSHIQQNIVHELAHVWRDTHFNDAYQYFANNLCGQGTPMPFISAYGATDCSEDFSEAVGYYVVRQTKEWQTSHPYCPTQNPYDWGQTSTYNWVKDAIFNGQQFGPPPTPGTC